MPQDLREATTGTSYAPDFIHPGDVQAMLDQIDGATVEIEIELEFNLPTTGNLTTVGGVTLIAPAMWALLAAQSDYGSPILPYVVSSYRSYAQQAALYAEYVNGTGNLAAPPGQSNHETGTALDITAINNAIAPTMAKYGWIRDVPSEAWHFHWVGF